MSITVPEDGFNRDPATPNAGQNSEAETTRRSFVKKIIEGVVVGGGAVLAGGLIVQSKKEEWAESAAFKVAATRDLECAMNRWNEIHNKDLSTNAKQAKFKDMIDSLKNYQTNKAHASQTNTPARDRSLPDWNMGSEEMLAGTGISHSDFIQLRGAIGAENVGLVVRTSEPGTESVKSLPTSAPTTETIAGN